jgi:hypothetical protein
MRGERTMEYLSWNYCCKFMKNLSRLSLCSAFAYYLTEVRYGRMEQVYDDPLTDWLG